MSWRMLPPVHPPLTRSTLARALTRQGAAPDQLRDELRARYGVDRVVLTDSGTSALRLALESIAPAGTGERVVALPGFACYDIATAAVGADYRIALYDIDLDTLGPDTASFERVLGEGAAAAVIAMPFGLVPDWETLARAAEKAGTTLIEDAAQSHGASLSGRRLGGLGALGILSFGRGKGWTGGGGGALLIGAGHDVASPSIADAGSPATEAVQWAKTVALWLAVHPHVYRLPAAMPWLGLGETRYQEPRPPRSMGAGAAALVLASSATADEEARRRRGNGEWYERALAAEPTVVRFSTVAAARPGHLRYPVRVAPPARRELIRRGRDLGLAVTYPTTLADLPAVRDRRVDGERMAGAARLVDELLTLPTHSRVREADRARIVGLLHDCARTAAGVDPGPVERSPARPEQDGRHSVAWRSR
jgi:perosamine synthetase